MVAGGLMVEQTLGVKGGGRYGEWRSIKPLTVVPLMHRANSGKGQ